jgi:hypothetical protein
VNGLPHFTAELAITRGDLVLVVASERPAQAWQLQRWYEESLCIPGSPLYACTGGTVCTASSSPQYSRDSVCCFPGRINCHGRCRDACAPGFQLNPATCVCEVVCPPCPAVGMIQDPQTCACRCPNPGEIPCHGVCIDPLTDETFCGGCPGIPCSPVDELCCNGVPTKIGTKQNCSDCGDQVPAGWDCCDFVPTRLGTNQHCRSCTEQCTGGRVCTPMGCQCPQGFQPCGGICWPATRLCCQDVRCPPNSTDCCPDCKDYWTLQRQTPAWIAWRNANPDQKWAYCLGGNFTCNPTLLTARDPQGQPIGCCPPGCTGFSNVTGMCTGCP